MGRHEVARNQVSVGSSGNWTELSESQRPPRSATKLLTTQPRQRPQRLSPVSIEINGGRFCQTRPNRLDISMLIENQTGKTLSHPREMANLSCAAMLLINSGSARRPEAG